jgi:hypothetical protein
MFRGNKRLMTCLAAITLHAAWGTMNPAAASDIDPLHKFSWSENLGWINWYDDGVSSGATIAPTFLGGFIWSENAGWINLGDGAPANGVAYDNTVAADFGVNIDYTGALSGYAWAENFGWITFDVSAVTADSAQLDFCAGRFHGYAWAENAGWINLDHAIHYVGIDSALIPLKGDINFDTLRDGDDMQRFLDCLMTPAVTTAPEYCAADMNSDGIVNALDVPLFVDCLLFGTCP